MSSLTADMGLWRIMTGNQGLNNDCHVLITFGNVWAGKTSSGYRLRLKPNILSQQRCSTIPRRQRSRRDVKDAIVETGSHTLATSQLE